MWIADQWKDYEVLDTSSGEKLERWGDYLLVRPDPQVIWNTPRKNPGWKKKNGHYHRSSKGGGEWEFFNLPEEWSIHYRELTFRLKPFSFKHTGLFPEQATNWDWFGNLIRMMNEEGKREGGHLNINKVILKDVIDLHGMLLQSTKFPIYNAEYYKVLPFIVELRQRGDKDLNEIETCLDALYGVMMLRLQKKEITPETERAIKEITVFIGLLSDYYIKDRTEGLKFDDDDM